MALTAFNKLKEKKKNMVLQAIVNSLIKHDYDELTIGDIATEAGISRGSFYNYFKDKNDAIYTLLASKFEWAKNRFKEEIINSNGDVFKATRVINGDIKEKFTDKVNVMMMHNLKIFMDTITKIFYSKNCFDEIDAMLEWLIENTNVGREKIKTKKEMANFLEILVSIMMQESQRLILECENNMKYEDFDYKLNIIKKGVLN